MLYPFFLMVPFIIYLSFQSLGSFPTFYSKVHMASFLQSQRGMCQPLAGNTPTAVLGFWGPVQLLPCQPPLSPLPCTCSSHIPWRCQPGQVCALVPSALHVCSAWLAGKTPLHPSCLSPRPAPLGSLSIALYPITQPLLLLSLSAPTLRTLLLAGYSPYHVV